MAARAEVWDEIKDGPKSTGTFFTPRSAPRYESFLMLHDRTRACCNRGQRNK